MQTEEKPSVEVGEERDRDRMKEAQYVARVAQEERREAPLFQATAAVACREEEEGALTTNAKPGGLRAIQTLEMWP
jgi:hypothetical protein